jgi:hypothetical protein
MALVFAGRLSVAGLRRRAIPVLRSKPGVGKASEVFPGRSF